MIFMRKGAERWGHLFAKDVFRWQVKTELFDDKSLQNVFF